MMSWQAFQTASTYYVPALFPECLHLVLCYDSPDETFAFAVQPILVSELNIEQNLVLRRILQVGQAVQLLEQDLEDVVSRKHCENSMREMNTSPSCRVGKEIRSAI